MVKKAKATKPIDNGDLSTDLEDSINMGKRILSGIQRTQENIPPRRFKGEDLRMVVGVTSLSTIYKAEEHHRIPAPDKDKDGKRLGATIDQVMTIQNILSASPRKDDDEDAVVVSFTNFKGGCWKTTTTWYAGSYYANLGLRVLLVDVDPQASLTLNCGLMPDAEIDTDQTIAPLLMGDKEDDMFGHENIRGIVRDTYLPNMKIIPSCLGLVGTEYALSAEVSQHAAKQDWASQLGCFYRLAKVLESAKKDFDLILLDGTPSLGILPLNIVFASDVVIVPVPTELTDYSSTITFCEIFKDAAETLSDHFRKTTNKELLLPDMRFLPTRYASSEYAVTVGSEQVLVAIRKTFANRCLKGYIRKHEAVVSNLSLIRRTVFDVNPGTLEASWGDITINGNARKRAMENFGAVYDEIFKELILKRWPSKKHLLEN